MLSEEQKFSVIVYLCIGAVVGLALAGLFVYMTGNHIYWLFMPLSMLVVFTQGFVRTKKNLDK